MDQAGNIVIGDESANFFLMHDDAARRIAGNQVWANPLESCARDTKGLTAFNTNHPLFGGKPVALLVSETAIRRRNGEITCRSVTCDFPARSFFKLRDCLYMPTPECAFGLAAGKMGLQTLVAFGVNLCGRYYLSGPDYEIQRRSDYLTTPQSLLSYVQSISHWHGLEKAKRAIGFIAPNSGSPAETQTWVQYCIPMRYGGIGLGFTHMNYDVKANRLSRLTAQSEFSIDLVEANLRFGLEFDGKKYHSDASKDKRRRNDLKVLGWDIYPIDATALFNPDETIRTAEQLAKLMGKRFRPPKGWDKQFVELRESIDLPA